MVERDGQDQDGDNADQSTPQHAVAATQETQAPASVAAENGAVFAQGKTEGTSIPKRRRAGRPKGSKRSFAKVTQREIADIVVQRVMGKTHAQISELVGISHTGVDQILAKFDKVFTRLNEVDDYRAAQGKLLDAAAIQLLESMVDPTCIAESKLNQRAYAFDKVAQQSRLVQGLSTANVATRTESIIKVTTK